MQSVNDQIADRFEYYLSIGYSEHKASVEAESDILGHLPEWEPGEYQED